MTAYDPQGHLSKWGLEKDKKTAMCERIDRIKRDLVSNTHSSIRRSHGKICSRETPVMMPQTHKHLRRRTLKIYRSIRRRIDDLYPRLAIYLCRNYSTILLPTFASQQRVSKKSGSRAKLERVLCVPCYTGVTTDSSNGFSSRRTSMAVTFGSWMRASGRSPVDYAACATLCTSKSVEARSSNILSGIADRHYHGGRNILLKFPGRTLTTLIGTSCSKCCMSSYF